MRLFSYSYLFCLTFLIGGVALAESRFDLKARGFAHINEVMPQKTNKPRHFNTGFKTYIAGVGRVEVKFSHERIYDVPKVILTKDGQEIPVENDITLLRGTLKAHGKESAVAGSLLKEGSDYVIKVGFPASNGRGGATNYYYLTVPVSGETGHVEKISRFAPVLSMHGDTVVMPKKPFALNKLAIDPPVVISGTTYNVLKIRIDGDSEWYSKYGKSSINKMQSYVNSAEAIYESQLGITFNVTKFNVASGYSLGTNDSESALYDFKFYTNDKNYFGSAEEYQLFSGRTFKESVLGIAFTGAICVDSSYALSITTSPKDSYGPIVFAHELGHSFGAEHTSSGIMQATLSESSLPKSFSSTSKQQILNHVKAYGGCLGKENISTPTPTPTATLTPEPTRTPGGGGNVDDDKKIRNLNMRLSLGRNGAFSAVFNYGEDLSACTVYLKGSTLSSTLGTSKIYYKFVPNLTKDTVKGNARIKIVPVPKNRIAYFLGEVYCPDGTYGMTGLKKLNVARVASKKKVKNKAAWIKRLFKTLKRQ